MVIYLCEARLNPYKFVRSELNSSVEDLQIMSAFDSCSFQNVIYCVICYFVYVYYFMSLIQE